MTKKLHVAEVGLIRKERDAGATLEALAARYRVSVYCIWSICKHITHRTKSSPPPHEPNRHLKEEVYAEWRAHRSAGMSAIDIGVIYDVSASWVREILKRAPR